MSGGFKVGWSYGAVVEKLLNEEVWDIIKDLRPSQCKNVLSVSVNLQIVRLKLYLLCRSTKQIELFRIRNFERDWCTQFAIRNKLPRFITSIRNKTCLVDNLRAVLNADPSKAPEIFEMIKRGDLVHTENNEHMILVADLLYPPSSTDITYPGPKTNSMTVTLSDLQQVQLNHILQTNTIVVVPSKTELPSFVGHSTSIRQSLSSVPLWISIPTQNSTNNLSKTLPFLSRTNSLSAGDNHVDKSAVDLFPLTTFEKINCEVPSLESVLASDNDDATLLLSIGGQEQQTTACALLSQNSTTLLEETHIVSECHRNANNKRKRLSDRAPQLKKNRGYASSEDIDLRVLSVEIGTVSLFVDGVPQQKTLVFTRDSAKGNFGPIFVGGDKDCDICSLSALPEVTFGIVCKLELSLPKATKNCEVGSWTMFVVSKSFDVVIEVTNTDHVDGTSYTNSLMGVDCVKSTCVAKRFKYYNQPSTSYSEILDGATMRFKFLSDLDTSKPVEFQNVSEQQSFKFVFKGVTSSTEKND